MRHDNKLPILPRSQRIMFPDVVEEHVSESIGRDTTGRRGKNALAAAESCKEAMVKRVAAVEA